MKLFLLALILISVPAIHANPLIQSIETFNNLSGTDDSLNCVRPPSCANRFLSDPESPESVCSELSQEDAPLVQNSFEDGTSILNPVVIDRCNNLRQKGLPQTNPEFETLVAPISDPSKIARVQQTIDDLKTAMISQISQSQPLTEGQRHLLYKLETMQVTFDGEDPGCRGAPFNASYAQNYNVMNVCPLLAHQTPETYVALLAHELGHLGDPCNSFHDRYHFSESISSLQSDSNAQSRTLSQRINECLSDVPAADRESFIGWATGNTRMHAQALIFYTREGINERRRYADRLISCGIVNTPENRAPTTFEGNPYLEVASCISQRHLENGQRIGPNSLIEEGSTCQTGSRQREIMADYIGSAITARYLNSRPRLPAERSTSLLNFFVAMQCASEREGAEYLSANDRMAIYLQQPEVQEALGCSGANVTQMLCSIPETLR